MRNFFDFLLLLAFLVFIFLYKNQIRNNFQFLLESPCDIPITYRLGEVDAGYGLTKQQFLDDLSTSVKIWDQVVDKNLFEYNANGRITVNLIYTDRQAISDNLNSLENKLEGGKESLGQMEQEYKNLQQDFTQKLQIFNQKVASFNRDRKATEADYNALLAEQSQLKAEADQLNNLARQLNLSVQQYNFQVGQYNQGLGNLQDALITKPEAGLYDGSIPKIDIYLTSGKSELIHTLAHEMGHALNLPHVSDPNSIMYPLTNEVLVPNQEESQTLQTFCKQKNYELIFNRFKTNLQ